MIRELIKNKKKNIFESFPKRAYEYCGGIGCCGEPEQQSKHVVSLGQSILTKAYALGELLISKLKVITHCIHDITCFWFTFLFCVGAFGNFLCRGFDHKL